MKVIAFTIPVRKDQTVILQEESGDQFYPHLHRHEEIQLTWVQKGAGTLVVGEQLLNFRAGEIFLFAPNLPHLFRNESPRSGQEDKRVAAVSLFFRRDHPLWHLPELRLVQQFLSQMQGAYRVRRPAIPDIKNTFMLIQESRESLRLAPFISMIQRLVNRSELELIGATVLPVVSEQEGLRMNAVLQYAMQHYQGAISLEEIARQAHMAPGSFCRFFKQHTGKTFVRFLNEIRIREACRLLAFQPDRQIAEVAFQCGFKNVTSFNRVFRQVKQQSPTRYLASLQPLM